jgi:hypothetical protein
MSGAAQTRAALIGLAALEKNRQDIEDDDWLLNPRTAAPRDSSRAISMRDRDEEGRKKGEKEGWELVSRICWEVQHRSPARCLHFPPNEHSFSASRETDACMGEK